MTEIVLLCAIMLIICVLCAILMQIKHKFNEKEDNCAELEEIVKILVSHGEVLDAIRLSNYKYLSGLYETETEKQTTLIQEAKGILGGTKVKKPAKKPAIKAQTN